MDKKWIAGWALCLFLVIPANGKKTNLPLYKNKDAKVEQRIEDLLGRMTLEEKIYQLNQYTLGRNTNANNTGEVVKNTPAEIGSLIYFGENAALRNVVQRKAMTESRLGIPILFGFDVIHGFRTVYPISLAQAASWNTALVEEACAVAAQESFSAGVNWTFSPMVDVARDGRWGRISEGYGEDPYANAAFAVASVKGYQGDNLSAPNRIAACLKHYVGYGASEAGRDYVPTEISDQTLWDTYLPPFEAGIKAGAATVMSAFNNMNGIPASANAYTLTDILKKQWNHRGFVVSDWGSVRQLQTQGFAEDEKEAAWKAFGAGVEMDMVDNCYQKYLPELIRENKVSMAQVDDAVRRVLRMKFELGLFDNPYTKEVEDKKRLLLDQSLKTAEMLAQESMVLLENKGHVLPLQPDVRKIAVIGPMAKAKEHLLGSWYAHGKGEDVISIYEGLEKEMKGQSVLSYAPGCDFDGTDTAGFKEAEKVAADADVVVLCLGEKRNWSGENASRSSIALPEIQEQLLAAVKRQGKPVVVLVAGGRSLELTRIAPLSDALLEIWQPGIRGGAAVAGILSGKYNPSARLPVTFPYSTGQIPIYYNRRRTGRVHQGLYQDIPSTPLYEFGYGLSYTDFEYGPLTLSASRVKPGDKLTAAITVTNKGTRDGKETVHWFISDPYCSIARPEKELKYFQKQLIKAGESQVFTFDIDLNRDLGFVNAKGKRFLESGDYYIIVKDKKIKVHLDDE